MAGQDALFIVTTIFLVLNGGVFRLLYYVLLTLIAFRHGFGIVDLLIELIKQDSKPSRCNDNDSEERIVIQTEVNITFTPA
ncbi:hypothetical protein PG990_002440 [Apiospora arundinis]